MKLNHICRKAIPYSFLITSACLGFISAQGTEADTNSKLSVLNPFATMAKDSEIDISGFVSTSYVEQTRASGVSNFQLEQAEIDFAATSGKGSFVLDLDFADGANGNAGYTFGNGDTGEVEQAYVGYDDVAGVDGLNVIMGKYNAPIGLEAYDAPGRSQWSLSYLFFNSIPANLTGAMVTYSVTDMLTLEAYAANRWDNTVDNNTEKTYGAGFTYENGDIGLTIAGDYVIGSENARTAATGSAVRSDDRQLIDLWAQYSLDSVLEGAWVAVAYVDGSEENNGTNGDDSSWGGHLFKAHAPIIGAGDTETLGITLRYEEFNDGHNFIGGTNPNGYVSGNDKNVESYTAALNFVVPETDGAVTGHLEWRKDQANVASFAKERGDGTPTKKDQQTLALNVIYSF